MADLTDKLQVENLFTKLKPDHVIHLAAYVGGLYHNLDNPVEMYEINTLINLNIIKCCHTYEVEKCIVCLSTCIFPDKVTYPISETDLHHGPPHASNFSYAYSKRMMDIHISAYRQQFPNRCQYCCVIPTNIYGEHDNFTFGAAHVIPELIHKCYHAITKGTKFTINGTGKPERQFLYSGDAANIIMNLFDLNLLPEKVILSPPVSDEISIINVAKIIKGVMEKYYQKTITLDFNMSKSDGQYKKTVDNSYLLKILPKTQFTELGDGLIHTIHWFIKTYPNIRC